MDALFPHRTRPREILDMDALALTLDVIRFWTWVH